MTDKGDEPAKPDKESSSRSESKKLWLTNDLAPICDNLTHADCRSLCLCFVSVRFTLSNLQSIRRFGKARNGNSLQQVSLFCCRGMVSEALEILLENSKELRLDGTILEKDACLALGLALSNQNNQTIQKLSFQGTHMTPDLANALSSGLRGSSCLTDLVWNNDGDCRSAKASPKDSIEILLTEGLAKNRSLKRLEFWHEQFNDEQVIRLLNAISCHPTLEHVMVPTRRIAGILGALHDFSAHNRCLRWFKFTFLQRVDLDILRSNPLPDRRGLQANPITYAFEFSKARDEDVPALGAALLQNPSIRTVDLSHTRLGDRGLIALAPCLRHVQELRLHGTDISKAGLEALLDTLRGTCEDDDANCALEFLQLPQSNCDPRTFEHIQHFVDLNLAGRRLLQIEVPLGVWSYALARVATMNRFPSISVYDTVNPKDKNEVKARRANSMFHLLQGPALLHRIGR